MHNQQISQITNDEELKTAIRLSEEIGDSPDFENSPKLIEQFEILGKLIGDYEHEHYPIEAGNPIEIIKLRMAYMDLTPNDLVPIIGSKEIVVDVLNKKIKLTKSMIQNLAKMLNIGEDILETKN